MYGFEPEGGPRCRGTDFSPKRLSRSCARWTVLTSQGQSVADACRSPRPRPQEHPMPRAECDRLTETFGREEIAQLSERARAGNEIWLQRRDRCGCPKRTSAHFIKRCATILNDGLRSAEPGERTQLGEYAPGPWLDRVLTSDRGLNRSRSISAFGRYPVIGGTQFYSPRCAKSRHEHSGERTVDPVDLKPLAQDGN
jgi:hypothetical protein